MGTNQGDRPAYTRHFWAKSDRSNPGRIHLLEHHLADVGAVFEALLRQPTIRDRLARSAGLEDLSEVTVARLAVFAALHDIGKVNTGFQAQIWKSQDYRGMRKPSRTGHTSDIVPVLLGRDRQTSQWFLDALGWDEFLTWDNDGGNTVCAMFAAAMSHHGSPLNLFESRHSNPRAWRPFGDLEPEVYVRRIGVSVRQWFPKAFSRGASIPSSPEFQHMFLGLCTLADWIGSDERQFAFYDDPSPDYIDKARDRAAHAIAAIGLDVVDQRHALTEPHGFEDLFDLPDGSLPNSIQQSTYGVGVDQQLLIVESETGSGKTEAALWRFSRMYGKGLVDGLYFALPTRAAAVQIHTRINSFAKSLFPGDNIPEPVLAVPGYVRAGDFSGSHLPDYQVWWEGDPDHQARTGRWAAESSKRFLAAQIAVGTVDQAMMAALQVRHSHMRAACLARNLLVVDEVHASDPYMRVIIEALLNSHISAGGYALLMSATLGSEARRRWLFRPRRHTDLPQQSLEDAINAPYPSLTTKGPRGETVDEVGENGHRKSVSIDAVSEMHEFVPVAERALRAAREGAKVLVIRNTVDYAIRTLRAVEESASRSDRDLLFTCNGLQTLHTGRFAAGDRRVLDPEVERQLGRHRPSGGRIVIGTQTLEQSLDIDADLLITDLCPSDVLLQRIGRLHRHDRDDRPSLHDTPTCVVLTPGDGDLSSLVSGSGGGLSPNGLGPNGYVYPDVRILELTRRLVEDHSMNSSAWRIPKMNRYLVERTTHPEALASLVIEMGDQWRVHAAEVEGAMFADNLTGRMVLARRDKSFLEQGVSFADVEQQIRTRLGDEGVDVMFDRAPSSPFDATRKIDKMAVPIRWLRNSAVPESVRPTAIDDGFEFEVGSARFRYDRMGLQRT